MTQQQIEQYKYSSFFRDDNGKFSTSRLTTMVLLALVVFVVIHNTVYADTVRVLDNGGVETVTTYPEALIAEIFVFMASLYGLNVYFTRGKGSNAED